MFPEYFLYISKTLRRRGVRKPCADVLRSRFASYAAQTCTNTAQLASYGLKAEVSGQTGVLPGRFLQRRAGLAKRHCVISGLEVNGNKKEIFRKIAPRHDSAGKYPSLPGTTPVCRELLFYPGHTCPWAKKVYLENGQGIRN